MADYFPSAEQLCRALRPTAPRLRGRIGGIHSRTALALAQHIRTQSVRSLHEFASFLQWLPHPYIAKQSERRALWRRDLGRSDALIERTNMQQSIGGLVEGALAVVLRQHQHLT